MLTIKDFSGVDLVANPPTDVHYRAVGSSASVQVAVQARIIEDDPFLAGMLVNGTLDWNDGSFPTVYDAASGTLTVDALKGLQNGKYMVSVYGHNQRAPVNDQVRVNFLVDVVQEASKAPPLRLIYGPILPRDNGFPNASQWDFNSDSDLMILESSARMLFRTAKGERIMEPEYGTNLRTILFDQNVPGIESRIQEEVVSALTKWEPRLSLTSLSVLRLSGGVVTVTMALLSKLNAQGFQINLEFVQ